MKIETVSNLTPNLSQLKTVSFNVNFQKYFFKKYKIHNVGNIFKN
jgi:hypothetical protein